MADKRKLFKQLLLLVVTVYTVRTESTDLEDSEAERIKYKGSSKSKPKVDKGNPWPFLPSPGNQYTANKGNPIYPFMILSPPGQEKQNEEKLEDEKGSKYYVTRRQSVPYPQSVVGYVPVYYTTPQYYNSYNSYQPLYMSYYQPDLFDNGATQQYSTEGQLFGYTGFSLVQNAFLFSKRSKAKKPQSSSGKKQPMKRQFVPRHHWSFSQWPFDSHEYAFAKDPIHSSNVPHLPRWGPKEWGGAGPGPHWAINREGLPSPFGIGLAPHMGGQGYIGLAGHWPAGYGYPLPTNFPTPPHLQHLLP